MFHREVSNECVVVVRSVSLRYICLSLFLSLAFILRHLYRLKSQFTVGAVQIHAD